MSEMRLATARDDTGMGLDQAMIPAAPISAAGCAAGGIEAGKCLVVRANNSI
jgi:hypothetical protein